MRWPEAGELESRGTSCEQSEDSTEQNGARNERRLIRYVQLFADDLIQIRQGKFAKHDGNQEANGCNQYGFQHKLRYQLVAIGTYYFANTNFFHALDRPRCGKIDEIQACDHQYHHGSPTQDIDTL